MSPVLANNKIWGYLGGSSTPTWTISTEIRNADAIISNNGKIGLIFDYDENLLIIDMATGNIIAKHTIVVWARDLALSDDGSIAAILTDEGTIVVYSITPSAEEEVPTFLEKYLASITNLDNIYALGSAALVGVLLGGILVGLGKKKKKKEKGD